MTKIARETGVERFLKDQTEKLGGYCLKLTVIIGIPDRLVILPGGIIAFVECKRPKGGVYSNAQKIWRKRLRGLGFAWYGAHTREEVRNVLAAITRVPEGCD